MFGGMMGSGVSQRVTRVRLVRVIPEWRQQLCQQDSASQPLNPFVTSELLNYKSGGDNYIRQSSSSSSSHALERKQVSPRRCRHRHSNGSLGSPEKSSSPSDELPAVSTDENVTVSIPSSYRQVKPPPRSHGQGWNQRGTVTGSPQQISSLTISAIKQDSPSPTDDRLTERLTERQSERNGTVNRKPPTSQNSSQAPGRRLTKTPGPRMQAPNNRKSDEPKYSDPIQGASSTFQSRLAELASLEAETVRWERLRKLKKKSD